MANDSAKSGRRWSPLAGRLLLLVALTVWCALAPAPAASAVYSMVDPSAPQTVPHDIVEDTPDPDGFAPLTVGDYFRCDIPRGWARIEMMSELSADEKKVYGGELKGPWSGETPPRISVFYYAEGNLLYTSVDHYLRVFAHPALGVVLEGSEYGSIAPLAVSGREGMTFERIKNEYVPLSNLIAPVDREGSDDPRVYERREMMARPVPVRERFVVLPAPPGFYALRYSAPQEVFPENLPVFEKVVTTFHAMK